MERGSALNAGPQSSNFMGNITVVNNMERFQWLGVHYNKRYSDSMTPDKHLVKSMRQIDDGLDLKFYLPTLRWHVVRYPNGRSSGKFVHVFDCIVDEERGLKGGPGSWILDALRQGDTWGAAENRVKDIDENNKRVEENNLKERDEIGLELGKELRKPCQDLYDFGPDKEHKRFH